MSWGEALQKKLEDCRGSLWVSQECDRTRNDQLEFKVNRFIFDQVFVLKYKPWMKLLWETKGSL